MAGPAGVEPVSARAFRGSSCSGAAAAAVEGGARGVEEPIAQHPVASLGALVIYEVTGGRDDEEGARGLVSARRAVGRSGLFMSLGPTTSAIRTASALVGAGEAAFWALASIERATSEAIGKGEASPSSGLLGIGEATPSSLQSNGGGAAIGSKATGTLAPKAVPGGKRRGDPRRTADAAARSIEAVQIAASAKAIA